MSGLFVVLEGIDGSGKSTAALEIGRRLEEQGIRVASLREPTEKTDASREIRRILSTVKEIDERISRELLDLFLIDRLWDIQAQIKPALAAGAVVLLDRYFLSTAAYQALTLQDTGRIMADYLGDERILTPDLLLYLKLPVQAALSRLAQRRQLDVFESEVKLSAIAGRYAEALRIFHRERPQVPVFEEESELTAADFDRLAREMLARLKEKTA